MMKKRLGLAGLTLALSLSMAQSANADGLYIGAGLYQSSFEVSNFNEDDAVPAAFVGFNFWDTVAKLSAELGYYDLGNFDEPLVGEFDAAAITGMGVAGVGLGPFVEVYAKAGLAAVSSDFKSAGEKISKDDMEPIYGLGASIDILDTIDIYAEYLKVDTDFDTDMYGVGVRFDF